MRVHDYLDFHARRNPGAEFAVFGGGTHTYADALRESNRIANAFVRAGLAKGDRVALLAKNCADYALLYYGAFKAGIVLVPLNYRLVAADHEYIIGHAGVTVILADPEFTRVVDEIRPRLPKVKHFVVAQDEGAAPAGWLDWETLVAAASPLPPPPVARDENDVVSLNYTSGTTARPKGVMLTHRNCYLNAYNLIAHLGIRHEDVELWTLPMFHCNGWGGVYAMTGVGGTHVILRAVDARDIFRLIETEAVTFACMAPAVLQRVLEYPDRSKHTITTKPRFVVAGAPPPEGGAVQLYVTQIFAAGL